MLQLHATNRPCGPTFTSGLKAISLIDPADLLLPLPVFSIPRINAIAFKPGRAAFHVNMEYFSGRYQERTTYNLEGTVYDHIVTFESRGININTDFLRAKLANRRVHVVVTLQDDTQRIVQSVLFQNTSDTGNGTSRNQYTFEGIVRKLKPAATLAGAINIISPPYVVPPTPPSGGGGAVEIVQITTTFPAHTYQVPAGRLLVAIFILTDTAQYVSIGYSAGQSELAGPFEQAANTKVKFGDNWIIPVVDTNIYITGMAGTNNIEICLL